MRWQPAFVRQLQLVTLTALVGMVLASSIALWGLRHLGDESRHLADLSNYGETLTQLRLQVIERESSAYQLTPALAKEWAGQNQQKHQQMSQRLEDVQLSDSATQRALPQIRQQFQQWDRSLTAWVSSRSSLGLNAESGIRDEMSQKAVVLEKELSLLPWLVETFQKVRSAEFRYIEQPDTGHKAALQKAFDGLKQEIRDNDFEEHFAKPIGEYQRQIDALIQILDKHHRDQRQLIEHRASLELQISQSYDYLQQTLLFEARQSADHAENWSQNLLIAASVGALVLVQALILWIGLGTRRRLRTLTEFLARVADGDLTQVTEVNEKRNDEFDQLGNAANTMNRQLNGLVTEVSQLNEQLRHMVGELNHHSGEIAGANESVSGQSNSMAAATEEISVTAEQIHMTAQQLQQSSESALRQAQEGGRDIGNALASLADTASVVERAAGTIETLNRESERIDLVLEMINELAGQTNLLALNAAIEAARAGDAGRGFAVVADEVRELADKTVKATSQIDQIVGTIQQESKQASLIMQQALEETLRVQAQGEEAVRAVDAIEQGAGGACDASRQITVSIGQVAETTREMAQRMDQIAGAVSDNTEAVGEIATASRQVHERANALGTLTARFQL